MVTSRAEPCCVEPCQAGPGEESIQLGDHGCAGLAPLQNGWFYEPVLGRLGWGAAGGLTRSVNGAQTMLKLSNASPRPWGVEKGAEGWGAGMDRFEVVWGP